MNLDPSLPHPPRPHLAYCLLVLTLAACLPEAEPAWDPSTTKATIGASTPEASPTRSANGHANQAILDAWAAGRSDVWLEGSGEVVRLLRDDLEGSRHQRLIVEVAEGHTILVSHNIDLAPKVPLRQGQWITFRGEYEWNDRGGVVHWTHHDPRGRREGGWIECDGERYR